MLCHRSMGVSGLSILIVLGAFAASERARGADRTVSLEEKRLIAIPPEHLQPVTLKGAAARGGYSIVIAGDGSTAAYVARQEGKHFVVVGSEKGPELEGEITGLKLSRDGKTVVYVVVTADRRIPYVNHKPLTDDDASIKVVAMRDLFLLSPDGARVAAVMEAGDKDFVIVDGQRGPEYPFHTVYVPVFSPDSKHFAYNVNQGAKCCVVLDGKPGPEFRGVSRAVFSADSAHMAYAAAAPNPPARPKYAGDADWQIMLDGSPGPVFEEISNPTFGADNTSLAYVAEVEKKNLIVFNGRQGQAFDLIYGSDGLIFSPDSKRIAYNAKWREETVMVVDEAIGPPLDSRTEFLFSPDSTRYAYKGTIGEKKMQEELLKRVMEGATEESKEEAKKAVREVLIDNGEVVGEFDKIGPGSVVFSPDSKTLGCAATVGGKSFILLNGKKGVEYEGILYGPVFSPDGKNVAYAVNRQVPGESKGFIVVNDVAGPMFEGVSSPVFSADSNHCAYAAAKAGKQFIVLDGEAGEEGDNAQSPAFSPDGKHLTYLSIAGREIWWKVMEVK